MIGGRSSEGWYRVPAVAAIAWIPFYAQLRDMLADVPDNAYVASREKAYDLLFDSGNRDPDEDLGPDGQRFFEVIRRHDYRGALLLDGLRFRFDPWASEVDTHRMMRLESAGFTPLRFLDRSSDSPRKRPYPYLPEMPGVGGGPRSRENPKIVSEPSRIQISHRVEFRLCKWLEIAGGLITFNFRGAATVWMEVRQTIHRDGLYRVEFSGTAVPSQRLYIDWRNCAHCGYDMLKASRGEMEGFFRAGRPMFSGPAREAPQRVNTPLVHEGRAW
jgi:hypothetical protein